jgi:hypothetical protein
MSPLIRSFNILEFYSNWICSSSFVSKIKNKLAAETLHYPISGRIWELLPTVMPAKNIEKIAVKRLLILTPLFCTNNDPI